MEASIVRGPGERALLEPGDADAHAQSHADPGAELDAGVSPPPPAVAERPEPAGADARTLAAALGVSVTLGDLLHQRGHGEVEATRHFLDPRLADLTRPDAMVDRDVAAERLAAAIRGKERIAVFGDYDCDGITSAAIVTEVLRALGGEATTLLASRFGGGYGVSPPAAERIIATRASLLVTCDCGSSDHEQLAVIGKAGCQVIVIDHHLVPAEPLPAIAFLNPHRPECGFPYKNLASCGLALSLGAALRKALGRELDLRRWLDLVAIGTIADVAPLDGDNRALVRAGLGALAEARRPGVRALCELAKIDRLAPLGGEDVAFRLAPRLNAPGRLGPPDLALELLLARTLDGARAAAAEIERQTLARREIGDGMLVEALAEIEREGWGERPAIVIGREGWNHGIVGILAGKLAERFARPVIVIGFSDGRGRGSVRGPRGARLFDAVAASADVLVRFGGHQAAAGVELELARLVELRERFEDACARGVADPAPGDGGAEAGLLVRLDADDDPRVVVRDLARLEPCGRGNPTPRFVLEARVVSAREVRGGHLSLELEVGRGHRLRGFAPALGARAAALPKTLTLTGRLRRDGWTGGDAVEVFVETLGVG